MIFSYFVAAPLSQAISPLVVYYAPGYSSPLLIQMTSYLFIQPITTISYQGWVWINRDKNEIEMV